MGLKAIAEFEPAGNFKILNSENVYVDGDKTKSLQKKLDEIGQGADVESATDDDINGIFNPASNANSK